MALSFEDGYKAGCIDTVKRCIVSNNAERAVIEAAKVWLEWFDTEEGNGFSDDSRFAAKVRALQEVE